MLRQVNAPAGKIQGYPSGDPRITVFKGVPYAKPPVGALRWRAPQPMARWDSTFDAKAFAPMAWQSKPGLDRSEFYTKELNPTAYEYEMSEDCLYLNIWSPAVTTEDRLPVLFYIHGGGYQSGYAYEMEFDGERLARQGIILVTAGYRLGVLGFFAHRDLTAEDPDASQGNYGVMDQTAAIRWVYENIAAFGGDPSRITIAGQSAGAGSVQTQLTTPSAKGMLYGAVMMSGGGLNGVGSPFKPYHTLEEMQAIGDEFLKLLGVSSVAEARRLPAEVVCTTGRNCRIGGRSGPGLWSPTIDNVYLFEDSFDAMVQGHTPDIPYLFGYCADEGNIFTGRAAPWPSLEAYEAAIRRDYGPYADRYLALADVHSLADVVALTHSREFSAFAMFEHSYAQLLAEQGRTGYMYHFQHEMPGDNAGCFHGAELWLVFHSLNRCWRPLGAKHYDLARQASGYWVNFVKTGNPNGVDYAGQPLPVWDKFMLEQPVMMDFKDEAVSRPVVESELFQLRKAYYMKRLKDDASANPIQTEKE